METIMKNQHIRLMNLDVRDENAFAIIKEIFPDKRVWIYNTCLPYMGTLNIILSKEEFEKVTHLKIK